MRKNRAPRFFAVQPFGIDRASGSSIGAVVDFVASPARLATQYSVYAVLNARAPGAEPGGSVLELTAGAVNS
jgi:hypothetical protein